MAVKCSVLLFLGISASTVFGQTTVTVIECASDSILCATSAAVKADLQATLIEGTPIYCALENPQKTRRNLKTSEFCGYSPETAVILQSVQIEKIDRFNTLCNNVTEPLSVAPKTYFGSIQLITWTNEGNPIYETVDTSGEPVTCTSTVEILQIWANSIPTSYLPNCVPTNLVIWEAPLPCLGTLERPCPTGIWIVGKQNSDGGRTLQHENQLTTCSAALVSPNQSQRIANCRANKETSFVFPANAGVNYTAQILFNNRVLVTIQRFITNEDGRFQYWEPIAINFFEGVYRVIDDLVN